MKKIISIVLCLACLAGCSASSNPSNEKEETVSYATTVEELKKEYPEIKDENLFEILTPEKLIDMLEHGTGMIFLSFPECPWCHAFLPLVEEVATKEKVDHIYYYNMMNDRENNTETYQKVIELLEDHLDHDKDGNPRIYVPDLTIIKDGNVLYHTNETSMTSTKEISPEDYWTEEKKQAAMEKMEEYAKQLAE